MLKCTLLKGLNTINFSLLQKNNLKTFFRLISIKRNLINYNKNLCFFKKQFFSTQELKNANTNTKGNIENSETCFKSEEPRIIIDTTASSQTDLVVKEKKKKKKIIKSKIEESKKNENYSEILNSEKSANQTQNISNNLTNELIQEQENLDNLSINKNLDRKINKEEKSHLKKQAYRNKIKEEINLKDLYRIQSSKMGPANARKFFDFSKFKYPNVTIGIYDKIKFSADEKHKYENLVPISPKLGPYIIDNPKIENKTYHWCSCGLSKKQPFCDSSHSDTGFRPVNFKLAEKCDSMMLCGCKLSKVAPFCDGATCIELKKIEEEGIKKQIEVIDTLPNSEKLTVKKPKKNEQIINNNSNNQEIKEKAI